MPDADVTYPGARAPDRSYHLDAHGIGLAVYEWGDAGAPPLLAVHGGFDFARTYDAFAPRLADAGWRVVSWDQRGHGDSDRAALYSWDADLRDAISVFDHVSPSRPVPVIGHSKGGGMMIQLADAQPYRISSFVNLDGIPYQSRIPDVAEHIRTKMMANEIAGWLEHRRRTSSASRKPGTLDELAARRARMNPRLSPEWLRYLASVGARQDDDGWRWKIDPTMRFGGFGPWRPEWTLLRLPGLSMPFLAVLGRQPEEMGWGTDPERVLPYLPAGRALRDPRRRRPLRAHRGARPRRRPGARARREDFVITELVHNRVTLALHQVRRGDGRPLLLLHGLGEAAPDEVPPWLTTWAGPIAALDFTGHGRSTLPLGGGYTAEILLADADIALAELGQATVLGRGLGAYVALQLAGSRPADVIGAVLADGPGLAGGATFPTSQSFFPMPPAERAPTPTRSSS